LVVDFWFSILGDWRVREVLELQGLNARGGGARAAASFKKFDPSITARSMKFPSALILNLFTFAGLLLLAAAGTAAADEPDAAAIFQQMKEHYSQMKTYQDQGVVVWIGPKSKDETPFVTHFDRAQGIRFAFSSPGRPKGVMWANGTGAFFQFENEEKPKQYAKLDTMVAAATGVSLGSASIVSGLLTPGGKWGEMAYLKDPKHLGSEAIDGVACHHLQLTDPGSGTVREIWIGKDDHVLRRLKKQFGDAVVDEFHREIKVNAAVDPNTFRGF
jgi:outer membrane lipoprotein-sorting protein